MKFILLLISVLPWVSSESLGSVHVRGQLLCDGEPFSGQKISVYKKNSMIRDDLVAHDTTDRDGRFAIRGSDSNLLMKPTFYVYIENWCNEVNTASFLNCAYTIKVPIPDSFVSEGNLPKSTFALDQLDLRTAITEETGIGALVYYLTPHMVCKDRD